MKRETTKKKHEKKAWILDRERDDVRGWPVRDGLGVTIGTVSELLVDTDSGEVTRVKLMDGRFLNAHDLQLGDRELFIDEYAPGPIEVPSGDAMPVARPTKH